MKGIADNFRAEDHLGRDTVDAGLVSSLRDGPDAGDLADDGGLSNKISHRSALHALHIEKCQNLLGDMIFVGLRVGRYVAIGELDGTLHAKGKWIAY